MGLYNFIGGKCESKSTSVFEVQPRQGMKGLDIAALPLRLLSWDPRLRKVDGQFVRESRQQLRKTFWSY